MLNKKLDEMLGEERFEALQELVKKEALKEVNEYDFILLYNAYVKTIQDKSDEAKESVAHIYIN